MIGSTTALKRLLPAPKKKKKKIKKGPRAAGARLFFAGSVEAPISATLRDEKMQSPRTAFYRSSSCLSVLL